MESTTVKEILKIIKCQFEWQHRLNQLFQTVVELPYVDEMSSLLLKQIVDAGISDLDTLEWWLYENVDQN